MEGISDAIVRDLLSRQGGMDLCVTEFIRVTSGPVSPKVLRREVPELESGGRTPCGTPVMLQLLGGRPDALAESARVAADMGAYGIDLNFGCPARRVNGHDGGAAILRAPDRLEAIVFACRRAVPDSLPVSAKIRLGFDDADQVVPLAMAAERGGADWLTIHGRTKVQMYKGRADWKRIALARAAVDLPVVANGDLFDPFRLGACRSVTGCRAFMLGRGAFRIPNLFRWMRSEDPGPAPRSEVVELLQEFVGRVRTDPRFRDPDRGALNRLKGWVRALGEADQGFAVLFGRLKRSPDIGQALGLLASFAADSRAFGHPASTSESSRLRPSRPNV